ncbi:T-cell surface glycoprotein CD8 alpha chain-like isoform X2 [Eublepharis macularius]|uniref:T-cell surface glycoprotein CD8 alpha chain-like isoform X2 n=1 Tax=Eublepharis macularius TaxID=481883 RepID=A0AA97K813_EUBMA|nr:T-cell surface glycoprotein CD8 alpha chain-like isoform X2 [Eublepharis macularius]
MASFSSLLRVSLILCYCTSQFNAMKIKMINKAPQDINARVELDCETSFPDAGVSWMLQRNDRSLHSILYINSRSRVTPENTPNYEATRNGNTYKLIVKKFKNQDEGIYYCIVFRNQVIHFSSGLSVFLPVRTTQAPTTQRRGPEEPNINNPHITSEPKKCSDATVPNPHESLMFRCDPYIWIPLSGGCFILLITLVITLTVCCDPRRRRRTCQCKRPLNGTNGKLTVPR